MNKLAALATWANKWQYLKAWGRPLIEVDVSFVERDYNGSTGCAWPTLRKCVIRAGTDVTDALVTILHELAHVAAPGNAHHGERWREVYAAAVAEVTGIDVNAAAKMDMDAAALQAVRSWWKRSRQDMVWKMVVTDHPKEKRA